MLLWLLKLTHVNDIASRLVVSYRPVCAGHGLRRMRYRWPQLAIVELHELCSTLHTTESNPWCINVSRSTSWQKLAHKKCSGFNSGQLTTSWPCVCQHSQECKDPRLVVTRDLNIWPFDPKSAFPGLVVELAVIVCPSVCLFVTRRYCVKTAKSRITQTTPRDSSGTLVFWRWWTTPHSLKFALKVTHFPFEHNDFDHYPLIAPHSWELTKKNFN